MKRRLTQQEQTLVSLGALVVVLLLAYAVVTGATSTDFRNAKTSLKTARREYREAVHLREDFENLNALIEERKRRIAQQERGFDLSAFIGRTESELTPRFSHGDVSAPQQNTLAGGKYLRTRIEFKYAKKHIGSIIDFLYKLENPQLGVIISKLEIQSEDPDKGDTFRMDVRLSVIEALDNTE